MNQFIKTLIAHVLALALAFPAISCADFIGKVVGVHDGDTLTIMREGKGQKVRLVEVDAPELRQDFGQASKDALSGLCFGKNAQVQEQGNDKYGRILGRVTCEGKDANLEQVKRGLAWFYVQYGHDQTIREAETTAKASRIGLWSQLSPIPPWEYRHGGKTVQITAGHNSSDNSGACGGKSRCGDMNSCAEARHYLNDCGVTSLDRDHDGIPCEKLCIGH